jgi:hypothetical protein
MWSAVCKVIAAPDLCWDGWWKMVNEELRYSYMPLPQAEQRCLHRQERDNDISAATSVEKRKIHL